MRKITPDSFEVYALDELEPAAREKAIEGIAEKLGGVWWDSDDIDDISGVLVYTLAEQFGAPGREKYDVGDFPGIDGIELVGWDLDRGSYLAARGTLTRENAPALPWAPGITQVTLSDGRGGYTVIDVETDEDDLDPYSELDVTVARDQCRELADVVEAAVEAAIQEALTAGRAEVDHKSSAEYAEDYILGGDYEFQADGTLYSGS